MTTLEKMDRLLLEQFLELAKQVQIEIPDDELMIAKEILKLGHHIRIEEVYAHLGRQFKELDTKKWQSVLEMLLRFRIVIKTTLDGAEFLEHQHLGSQHYHMVCLKTATVKEFASKVLEEVVYEQAKSIGFQPLFVEVNVYGISGSYVQKQDGFVLTKALENQVVEIIDFGNQDEEFFKGAKDIGLSKGSKIEVLGLTKDRHELLARFLDHRLIINSHKAENIVVRALELDEAREELAKMNRLVCNCPSLWDLKNEERAIVIKVSGKSPFKARLTELGFVSGSPIVRLKTAPLGDPVEYEIRGFRVSLRKEEAEAVLVEKLS